MTKARTVKVESRKAYRYVYGRDVAVFEEDVNKAIAEGYFPTGGIQVNDGYLYSQALVDRDMLVELLADAVRLATPIMEISPP